MTKQEIEQETRELFKKHFKHRNIKEFGYSMRMKTGIINIYTDSKMFHEADIKPLNEIVTNSYFFNMWYVVVNKYGLISIKLH